MGEYPEGHPKPPFNCTAIGHSDGPVGQPKWQLRSDGSVEILHPRYRKLAVGGWRNEVRYTRGAWRSDCLSMSMAALPLHRSRGCQPVPALPTTLSPVLGSKWLQSQGLLQSGPGIPGAAQAANAVMRQAGILIVETWNETVRPAALRSQPRRLLLQGLVPAEAVHVHAAAAVGLPPRQWRRCATPDLCVTQVPLGSLPARCKELMHVLRPAGLECTHFCFPSAPQLWVHALWRALQTASPQMTPFAAASQKQAVLRQKS